MVAKKDAGTVARTTGSVRGREVTLDFMLHAASVRAAIRSQSGGVERKSSELENQGTLGDPEESEAEMTARWLKVRDDRIRHMWRCPSCGRVTAVGPSFYEDAGTPVCVSRGDCEGDDMEYVQTEALLKPSAVKARRK